MEKVETLISTLSDKIGNDPFLHQALLQLKEDVWSITESSLQELPQKIMLIGLDLVEVVGDLALDIANVIVDLVLDFLGSFIQSFKTMITANLHLPFVTDLFRILTTDKANPNGKQLTVLNFSTLLIAIPAKLMADYFDEDLVSLIPSFGQSLNSSEKWCGYIYAACMLVNGGLNAYLDIEPPLALKQSVRVEMAPLHGRIPIPRTTASINTKVNNLIDKPMPGTSGCGLPLALLFVDLTAQLAGAPIGSGKYPLCAKWDKLENKFINVIWIYQWIQWGIDCAYTLLYNRPENDDIGLTVQGFMEVVHFVGFVGYFGIVEDRYLSHWAFLLDPFEGIIQMGRTKEIMAATEGGSYLAVPVGDIVSQGIYSLLYAIGIAQQS